MILLHMLQFGLSRFKRWEEMVRIRPLLADFLTLESNLDLTHVAAKSSTEDAEGITLGC